MANLMQEYRKKFYSDYYEKILPLLTRYEDTRLSYLTKIKIAVGIVIALAIAATVWFTTKYIAIILIIALPLIGLIILFTADKFVRELKNNCLRSILKCFGDVEWDNQAIPDDELNQSDLFSIYNLRSTDDGFWGSYNGVDFKISETLLQHETGSGKNRTVETVFKGVVIKFASNKTIKNKTLITTKRDMHTKRNIGLVTIIVLALHFGSILLQSYHMPAFQRNIAFIIFGVILLIIIYCNIFSKNKEKKLNKITLEDPVFNKKFNVYSSDQVEARYLVTTSFMERFLNLKTAFGAKMAKCSFYDDSVMFAISTGKNLFEIGNLFHRLDNPKQLEKFFNELSSVLSLIDYFKLNEHTGL